ncbi:NfeD family protein [Actinomyces vulturis]|uniref:NfeD family protein n=1 Tax=Actinomyces vulturis TaxID=1857645 RepID=UPI00082D3CC8|nr:NfeD family protein [Actinomyces vulturis]
MMWLWWLVAALGLGVVEMLSVDLVFLMFASGALAASLVSLTGVPLYVQIIVFGVVSTLGLAVARPWAKRYINRSTPHTDSNVHALIGATARVLQPVDLHQGLIELDGAQWSARLETACPVPQCEVGSEVRVITIDGATAVVTPMM